MAYYLGIDNGSTMSKAALYTKNGKEVAVASMPVKAFSLQDGWCERDGEEMWRRTCSVIREVLNRSNIDPSLIEAISCTGHENGLYLIDSDGVPVRNTINSTDSRASEYITKWIESGVDKKVLPLTAQSIWAAQPNAILAWLIDNEPETVERASWILMAKDYIRSRMTGEIKAEITDMSGTSLMNVVEKRYDNRVLELFGIEQIADKLPPLIDSSDIAGYITEECAEITGLRAGTAVAGGMFDIDACALASGITDENTMSLVAGTWGNNQYISKEPLIDKDLFMTSVYADPEWYLILEGSPTSAGNLNWFLNGFYSDEKSSKGDKFYPYINSIVESIAPESSNVIFLPFIYGCNERCTIPAQFYNMNRSDKRETLLRAVYEGVAFAHKRHVDRLLQFRDTPKVIRSTGGASNSRVWMQMFADILNIPIEIPKGKELGTLGAAISATVAAGVYPTLHDAAANMTSIEVRYEPNIDRHNIYMKKYLKYLALIEQQRGK